MKTKRSADRTLPGEKVEADKLVFRVLTHSKLERTFPEFYDSQQNDPK